MNVRQDNPGQLSVSDLALIDRICVEFEKELCLGRKPAIESFLNRVEDNPSAQTHLLIELVALEVEFLGNEGELPTFDLYQRRFPEHKESLESIFNAPPASATPDPEKGNQRISKTPPVRELKVESRYRITRYHARGGLGVVFVATDADISREVAVKFSRLRRMDDAQQERFQREADITGRLEHPGIVPVYAIKAQDDSPPCYVMRFVEGETMQKAVKRFHSEYPDGVLPETFNGVRFRQLLQQLISVCNTVNYAHVRNVIHRDIKPGNIMLGSYGETLLLDWGLAKVIGSEELAVGGGAFESGSTEAFATTMTRTGQVMGTPAFASPEQLLGHLDDHTEKSDVYSLGSTLYFMLTGRRPLELPSGSIPTREEICSIAPAHETNSGIPRTLDAICNKAMAFEQEARYASAELLATDLETWLADEPVDVFVEPWFARCRRWVRKNHGYASAIAAGLVVGLMGLTAGSIMLNEKNREYSRLNSSLIEKNVELESANEHVTRAQDQTMYALKRLTDNNAIGRWMARQETLDDADREYIAKIIEGFGAFASLQGDDSRSRELRAEGLLQVGSLRVMLGETKEAETALRECLQVCKGGNEPMTQQMELFAGRAAGFLGEIYYKYDTKVATSFYEQAISHLSKPSDEGFQESESRKMLAKFQGRMGELNLNAGNEEKANRFFAKSLANLNALVESDPDNPEFQQILAFHYGTKREFTRAIELLSQLVKTSPDEPRYRFDLSVMQVSQAYVFGQQKKRSEAIELLKKSNRILQELANEYPLVPKYKLRLSDGYSRLARQYVATPGENPDKEFENALSIVKELCEKDPGDTAFIGQALLIENNYARYLGFRNDSPTKVERHLRHCVDLTEDLYRLEENLANATRTGVQLNALGKFLFKEYRFDDAVEVQLEAIESISAFSKAEQRQQPQLTMLMEAYERLAVSHIEQKEYEEAIVALELVVAQEITDSIPRTRSLIAICLAGSNVEKAQSLIHELSEAESLEPMAMFNVAVAAAMVSGSLAEEDQDIADESADIAMNLLERLYEDGFFKREPNQAKLRRSVLLKPIRDRDDFKKLARRLDPPATN